MAEKRLTLSKTDKKLAGVCGGLAEHLGIDSTLIRVVLLLFTLMGGCGLLFYLICWIVFPKA